MASSCLEDSLFRWVREKNNEEVTLSRAVVRHHAEHLLEEASRFFPDDEKIVVNGLKIWLERFKERF